MARVLQGFEGVSTMSREKRHTGVICRECGHVGLLHEEYMQQMMAADSRWFCPLCHGSAEWDDERYDNAQPEEP